MQSCRFPLWLVLIAAIYPCAVRSAFSADSAPGEPMLADYFRSETARLAKNCSAAAQSSETWQQSRAAMRQQLWDMYGLNPLPARGNLKPVVTGTAERDEIVVEKLQFQSLAGLYVTANLYRPKVVSKPLPTVLYLCGHSLVKKGQVSFGNKCAYTHHGSWFARNGYVCLMVDTLQLGEIEGVHHGTRRFDRWWWMCRGYTPAGVELWNNIRALDYLETRPEVDRDRIGVTGRSGGGAYSWSLLGLDDRVKVAVPVAGVVDLKSYVVDGAIEGHCDCMFFTNTYEWDYPQLAAMAAPRPVLLANTDKDHIFPLDGVLRVHEYMRRVYGFEKATEHFGLQISEGPHKDIPELQVAAFRWLNRFLKNEDPPIDMPAAKMFAPEELRVFNQLPADEINTRIDDFFVPAAKSPSIPTSQAAWEQQRKQWLQDLRELSFRAWPVDNDIPRLPPLDTRPVSSTVHDGLQLCTYEFCSQSNITLPLWVLQREGVKPAESMFVEVLDQSRWPEFLAAMKQTFPKDFASQSLNEQGDDGAKSLAAIRGRLNNRAAAVAFVAPRGIGPTAWDTKGRQRVEKRRRFLLLGQTLDGMQTFDIRRACQALRSLDGQRETPLRIAAREQMAGNALYASLFEPNISRLDLTDLPHTHKLGPFYLNVLRVLDMPQAVAMAADRCEVHLYDDAPAAELASEKTSIWNFPLAVKKQLAWPAGRLQFSKADR